MKLHETRQYLPKQSVTIIPMEIVKNEYIRAFDGCHRAKTCLDCPEEDCKLYGNQVTHGNSEAARLMLIRNNNRERDYTSRSVA